MGNNINCYSFSCETAGGRIQKSMAEAIARDGDHLVITGATHEDTGMNKAVLFHNDGTSSNVLVSTEPNGSNGQDCRMEPCHEFEGTGNIVRHVRTGLGHRGPAIVACAEFKRRFDLIQWRSREGVGRSDQPD